MSNIIITVMSRKVLPKSDFGKRLFALRKAKGLTQVELAKACKTTQRAISHYETEASYPPAPVIVAIADALRVSTDELLGVKKLRRKEQELLDQRLWKKFKQINALPDRDLRAIIRMINTIVAAKSKAAAML